MTRVSQISARDVSTFVDISEAAAGETVARVRQISARDVNVNNCTQIPERVARELKDDPSAAAEQIKAKIRRGEP